MNQTLWAVKILSASCCCIENCKSFRIEHDYFTKWMLLLVEEGSVTYRMNHGSATTLNAGELLLCPPYSTLDKQIAQPATITIILYTPENDCVLRPGMLPVPLTARMKETLRLLKELNAEDAPQTLHYRQLLLLDIWYQLCRICDNCCTFEPDDRIAGNLHALLRYIDRQLHTKLSLSGLARLYGCAPQTLIHLFKTATGSTPCEYISSLRVDKAKKLLSGSGTLKDIAAQCGFANEYYLSTVFKKTTGMTPSAFRRAHP